MATVWFKILDLLLTFVGGLKRVSVQVHEAVLAANGTACFFINARNTSPTREIEVTHVWLAIEPELHVINPARPLPKRLRPDETWETWLPVSEVPKESRLRVARSAKVQISTGKVFTSQARVHVPPVGYVPGA
jgi:hypothetical protein